MDRRDCLLRAAALLLAAAAVPAFAQVPPPVAASPAAAPPAFGAPLQIVVPDAVGSTADGVARVLAPALGVAAGRLVAVSNRPGGHEADGTEAVAKAGPDGTTALLASGALAINAAVQAGGAADPLKTLTPVALVATAPYVLVAATTLPLDSVQEVIAIAKANPGRLQYAVTRRGGPGHLAAEMLKSLATIQLTQALYPDNAAAFADLAAGKVQLWFGRFDEVQPLVKSGKARVIAVTGPRRLARAPDVPTMAESGVPGFDVVQWFGLFVPGTTPKATVDRLAADVRRVLEKPEVRDRLAAQYAFDMAPAGAGALDTMVRRDLAAWTKLARDMNLQVQ